MVVVKVRAIIKTYYYTFLSYLGIAKPNKVIKTLISNAKIHAVKIFHILGIIHR